MAFRAAGAKIGTNATGLLALGRDSAGNSQALATGTDGALVVGTTGLTVQKLQSGASTNATVIKNAPGKVYGWRLYNNNAAIRKVVFHDAATTPTAGAGVYFAVVLRPNAEEVFICPTPIDFSTGIAITTVTGITEADAVAVGANDIVGAIFYK